MIQSATSAPQNESSPLFGARDSQNGSDAAATAASDFNNFLMLLTAQMRNQDPLAPLDSTQFVEQLASFSSVEQQIETNTKLESIASMLGGSNLEAATPWIGKTVELPSGAARFDGVPLSFEIPEDDRGLSREAVVTNSRGEVVFKKALNSGETEFSWNGERSDGGVATNGDYRVAIDYIDGDAIVDSKEPTAVTSVTEARLIDGGVKLVLANGAIVDPDAITAVRASAGAI